MSEALSRSVEGGSQSVGGWMLQTPQALVRKWGAQCDARLLRLERRLNPGAFDDEGTSDGERAPSLPLRLESGVCGRKRATAPAPSVASPSGGLAAALCVPTTPNADGSSDARVMHAATEDKCAEPEASPSARRHDDGFRPDPRSRSMLSDTSPATPPVTPRRSPSDATAASPSAVAPTTEPCGSTRDSRGSFGSQRQESRGSSQRTHKRRRHELSAAADSNGATLDQFFARVDKPRPERDVSAIAFEEDALDDDEAEATAAASPGVASCASPASAPDCDALDQQVKQLSAELDELRSVALELDHAQRRLTHAEHSTELLRRALTVQVRELARQERLSMARKTAAQCERLGHVTVIRTGTTLQEAWEDGTEFRHLAERTAAITAQREAIDRSRKELTRLRKPPAHGDAPPTPAAPAMVHYIMEQEETFKIRLQHLRREEASLAEERARLECEKVTLMRELKRVRDENASRFNDFPLLAQRYLLMRLLGRGGFSEVWKAFDLLETRYVACKVHQLHGYWSEAKKSNYIRHATREYRIHASLKHPRVVCLYDVFEIDDNSFCTVLEYCGDACDLDSYLKMNRVIPEREAKSVIAQVLSGLLYLNSQPCRIIHYDLKPGNILYTDGEVRITDFGLSKIMEEDSSTLDGMELTSQGAGTYWYLPPECFEMPAGVAAGRAPRISSKVDVWSCGVIFYQMLFGSKPFGNELTQERILREQTILKAAAHELEFPAKPSVSSEAKEFMRLCLTRRQADRPDIRSVAHHPYLRGSG